MYLPDRLVPTVKLRYTPDHGFKPVKRGEPFIKGPIPMSWISCAAKLPGKAIHVALALFWLAGMKPLHKIKVTRQALKYFSVSDDAYRDALPRLEEAGLIKVWRAPGKRAQVEIVRTITPVGELDP
jgi:hypothetical protein